MKLGAAELQVSTRVPPAAGLFVSGLQQRKVIDASRQLKVQLQDIIAAMANPTAWTQFTAFKTIGLKDTLAVAQLLNASGVLS
ncbi:hypothetical protein [Rhodopila sp.]|uniref:hypothetical protein n=1 Tax=Rhodopila sp. TaxID=2480087 RepID=UPI003D12D570